MSSPSIKLPPLNRPLVIVGSIVIFLFCAVIVSAAAWSVHLNRQYDDKIFPHVSVADMLVVGQTEEAANKTLKAALGKNKISTIAISVQGKTHTLSADTPDGSFMEPSLTLAKKALSVGRSGNPIADVWTRLYLSIGGSISVPLSVNVDPEKLRLTLEPKLQGVLSAPQNAVLDIQLQPFSIQTIPEKSGTHIDWIAAADLVESRINRRETGAVTLTLISEPASITAADLGAARTQAEQWANTPTVTLTALNSAWPLTATTVRGWITTTSTAPHTAQAILDPAKAEATFHLWLGANARTAQDGFVELDEQGILKTFIAPKDGVVPDSIRTLANIETAWATNATTTELVLNTAQPVIRGEAAERLGIRELIGRGSSDFSGSPTNRIKNIRLGAEHVDGTIIPAGEEFSMLKVLGEIDGAHGWFPELVIKGNKTTPEFGGGLCQIGTTAFRAAMNTGLLITERQNHSYRVRYYEPAGTDATIYDPAPDFRFKNDTKNAILITADFQGSIVTFSVWGTKDGRSATVGKSIITNIVPPPPKKLIETTDLKPGQIKCTETAHAGATAKVNYDVTYGDGQTKNVTFTSVYRPWGAVCLVGVDALTPVPPSGIDQTGVNNPN